MGGEIKWDCGIWATAGDRFKRVGRVIVDTLMLLLAESVVLMLQWGTGLGPVDVSVIDG